MNYECITTERDGAVLFLTFNRPGQGNALSITLAKELFGAVSQAAGDPTCHVLVLQGAGKFFCAGGDVGGMAEAADQSAYLQTLAGTMHEALLALAGSRLITIAAVHGPAAGAGLGLVLNADFVIATPQASFLSAYAGVGLTPDCGVSYLLPLVAGQRRAAEICLGGRVVGSQEAVDWGLVTEVVTGFELADRVRSLAHHLAGGATQTLGPTKRLLERQRLDGYAGHLADEAATISALVTDPDTRSRISAFAVKNQQKKSRQDSPDLASKTPTDIRVTQEERL